jgi:hypothetical protein
MQKGLKINHFILYGGLLIVGLFAFAFFKAAPTEAATGVNQTINFQGRLLNSQGATVPDGFYNIQFKIYQDGDGQSVGDTTGSPSGSLKWTESHLNNNSQGVKVVNGYLSVQLGLVTAFGSNIDWNQDTLWLSMNVGNANATCTPFSSCSPDGEMVPMQPMTAAPYALNSGLLGGIASSGFVQLAQGTQTDATNVTSIGINKTGSGDIVNLQSSGTSVFSVNTTGNTLKLGVTGSTNANSTIHIADSSAGVQTITIGSTNSSSATTIQAGSGGVTVNGNTTISGANTFTTGTGAVGLNGDTTIASGKTFTDNGTALFKTNSATAFQVQNTSTTNFFAVDTNSNIVNIGVTGTVNANSTIHIADSSAGIQAVTLGSTNSSSATTIQAGSGGVIVNGNTTISGTNTFSSGTGNVSLNGDTAIANDKAFTANGAATFKDNTNSATAFQIQKSSSSDTLFTADTSANKLIVGNATGVDANTTLLVLDSATADPATGYNGAQYYNSNTGKFRCYQNGAWTDCITAGVTTLGTYSSANHYSDGANITGNTITLGSADATHPGLVDTSSQTFTGDKTFKAATFTVQSTGAQSLLIADTSTQKVAIGPAAAAANSVLTIGTSTTAASGGITFGTDTSANLYRSNSAELTTAATLNVAALQSSGDISFTSTSAIAGAITKTFITDTNGVNQFDVVIMSTIPDIETTTTARDSKVFGVSQSTIAAGGTGNAKVVTSGNYRVNVDTLAVAIGDQLVTSTTPGRATVDNNATTGIIGRALSSKSAGANGTVSVYVNPINGQYTPTFRGSGTSATAFQVQNSNGNNFLAVDTVSNIVNIGITGSTNVASTINLATSSANTQIVNIGSSGNVNNAVTINSGGTGGINLNGNTTIGGSSTFSTGSGLVSLNGDTTMASGKNFTQNGAAAFTTGSGNVALNGSTTVATGKTFTVTDSATTLGGKLDVAKSTALKAGADFSTAGTTDDAIFGDASLIRLTAATAQTITGIQNGRDGYVLTLVNAGLVDATLKNENLNSTNINRITTGSGGSILLQPGASIILVYDGPASRWRAQGSATLQSAYNNSTSPQITLDSTHGGLVIQDASSAIGNDLFTVQSNAAGTKYLNVTSSTVSVNDILAVTGNVTASGTYNTNTFTSTALQFGGASGTISTSAGNLAVQANGANTLSLDTTGAGTVGIATGNATTINIATNATAHAIHIGDAGGGTTQTITIGSNGVAADSVTINAGNNPGAGITLGANTVVSGANTFGTGTGAVSLNGDTTIASGKNFTQSGGGTFTTGSGANTLSGDTSVAGSHTFDTGTGNVGLNGNTTVASGKSFTANGTALFKTSSATAFQVQNTNSRNILAIDTTTNVLTVGNSTDGSVIALGANGNANSAITKNMAVTGAVSANDLVQVDTANDGKVKQAVASSSLVFGIATAAASSANDDIAIAGVYQVNADATALVPGDLLVSSSTAGKVTKAGSTVASGTVLGRALSTKGAGTGLVWVTLTLGVGGSDSLQTAYNNSTGGATPEVKLDSTRGALNVQDADTTISGSLFTVTGSSGGSLGTLFDVQSTGATLIGSTSQTATITLGQSTDSNTINIGNAATASGKTQAINIGANGASGSTTNITIGSTVAGTTTINGATAVNITGNTTITGANTFTTGTGAVSLNGDTTIASGKNFTQSGGGTFTTGSGANTLSGDTTVSGAHTFTTGTGAVALNGATTVASNKAFTANGDVLFKDATGSASSFQVQNTNNRNVFTVDTSGNIATVGNNTDGAGLTLNATGNANAAIRKSMVVTGTIAANDLVEIDTSNAGQVKQAAASSSKVFGVASSAVGSGSAQDIVISGIYQINANNSGGTIAVGDTLISSSTAGQITKAGTTTSPGTVVGLAMSTLSAGKVWVYLNLGLGGSDNLQSAYTKSTGGSTPEIALDSTRGGLDIQDASITVGNLFTVQKAAAAATYFGITNSTITMQDTSAANAVVIDLTGHNLKVYSSDGTTNYANISATNTDATFQSNTGTTKIGNGSGAITVNAGASAAVTITGHATSTWSLDSGNLTIDVTSASTPSLSLGTGSQAKNVTIGNGTGATATSVSCGTGTCGFGNNATDHSTTLGSTTGTSAMTIQSGTGGISLSGNTSVSAGKLLTLGSQATVGGACTSGAMYYDSSTNRFKGCESSAWITLDNYADIQTYAASGSWTKLANVSAVQVIMVGGGGGGGGGGARNGGQERNGGGGGGGGAYVSQVLAASDVASGNVTVGAAGGTGAGAASSATAGTSGGAGGTSCFSSASSCGGTVYVQAYGGGGGGGGNQAAAAGGAGAGGGGTGAAGSTPANTTNTAGSGGGPAGGAANASTSGGAGAGGGSATSGAGTAGNAGGAGEYGGAGGGGAAGGNATSGNGGSSVHGAGGGGAGGSTNSGNATGNAGVGGVSQSITSGGGGAIGSSGCTGGSNGSAAYTGSSIKAGAGGGGGGANGGGGSAGCNGGNGGQPGGGGGGGGSGSTSGGTGGSGGTGEVWIISW